MFGTTVLPTIALGFLLTMSSSAQTRDESWKQCTATGGNVLATIRACTSLIESGHEISTNLVIELLCRGRAYAARRDYDSVLHDVEQAIRLNPTFAEAFVLRGLTYNAKGDTDRAIQSNVTEYAELLMIVSTHKTETMQNV
jgi:tetratricopeptide (TPR) repeat protein